MNSPEPNEEVARRVRRVVGLKVMRDLHKLADDMHREDQQRPLLMLKLLLIVVVLVLVGVAVLRWVR